MLSVLVRSRDNVYGRDPCRKCLNTNMYITCRRVLSNCFRYDVGNCYSPMDQQSILLY